MKKFKKGQNSSRLKKINTTKIKRRRIQKKIKLVQYSLKDIPQILSPHNSTQYIIENNSSPFYFDENENENEEDYYDFNLSLNPPFLSLESKSTTFSSFIQEGLDFKNSYSENEFTPTSAQSQVIQNSKLSLE